VVGTSSFNNVSVTDLTITGGTFGTSANLTIGDYGDSQYTFFGQTGSWRMKGLGGGQYTPYLPFGTFSQTIQSGSYNIFKVENQIEQKILGEVVVVNDTYEIPFTAFLLPYFNFYTYSIVDMEITTRYVSGTQAGIDYISTYEYWRGNSDGFTQFNGGSGYTYSRTSYNNVINTNDINTDIIAGSSNFWGGDELYYVLTSVGYTTTFAYEIILKYTSRLPTDSVPPFA
jgi:hypothetical protein